MQTYYTYILANKPHGKLYIGVTNNLLRRMIEHREGRAGSYTKRHNITQLMHFETTESVEAAIAQEKRWKNWHRDWKKNLLMRENPQWQDYFPAILNAGQ